MRKNKMICSLTSVFLAVLMIMLGALSPIGAVGNMEITEDTTVKPVVNSADKIDPALKEIIAEASPDEKIPVAIWYEDIDQEQVDMLTTQKVGFSEEEIAVDYEMPST